MKQCKDEGQSICKRCWEIGLTTAAQWKACDLYTVDGYEGQYCYQHAKELEEKQNMKNNINNPARILNCEQCGKPIKQDEANVYFYHVKGSKGIKHNRCHMVCSDCYDKLRKDTVMNKQKILEEIQKTEEHLTNMKKMLEECQYERWKPKSGEQYFFVDSNGDVVNCLFDPRKTYEIRRCDFYNCFKTLEQAEAEAEKILVRHMLEDIARRLNNGKKIDWHNSIQDKHYIYLLLEKDELACASTIWFKNQGTVYCLDETFLDVAIREIGEKRLKNYLRNQ